MAAEIRFGKWAACMIKRIAYAMEIGSGRGVASLERVQDYLGEQQRSAQYSETLFRRDLEVCAGVSAVKGHMVLILFRLIWQPADLGMQSIFRIT